MDTNVRCRSCGAALESGARFCSRCGEAHSRTPGELRQVTVMFCDLVGSTELSARLEEEEFFELLHAYHGLGDAVVERFGGHIAEYLGDGMLVYFGFPVAREDAAERAIRCALEIIREAAGLRDPEPVAVRVGIHTGPVVIGEVGGKRRETRALGLTVNTAARLQAVAMPGAVVISDATLGLVPRIFETEALGAREIKGVPEPVALHRVMGMMAERKRVEDATARVTPFVGRASELAELRELADAVGRGAPRHIRIVGEAGVGKSRLLAELKGLLAEQPHTWIDLPASQLASDTPFHPVAGHLRREWEFDRAQNRPNAIARLDAAAAALGLERAELRPLFAELLDLAPAAEMHTAIPPEQSRKLLLDAILHYFTSLARSHALFLVFEDAHWLDPSSLELIGLLAERSEPLALVVTSRPPQAGDPAPLETWPALALEGLDDAHAREIVGLAAGTSIEGERIQQLIDRSNGIPLYLEELARFAAESTTSSAVPHTLQDLLMAALDRAASAKETAQVAAVLGDPLSVELLSEVAERDPVEIEAQVDALVANRILVRESGPGDGDFRFRHALLRDTAYGSLLKRHRKHLHGRIADVLLEKISGVGQPDRIAHHERHAGRHREAANHYREAGERAMRSGAYVEANRYQQEAASALEQLDDDGVSQPELVLRVQLDLGYSASALHGWADGRVQRAYERARGLAEKLGDREGLVMSLAALAISHGDRGQTLVGIESAERIGALGSEDPLHRFLAHCALVQPTTFHGSFARSLEHAERALAVYDPAMDAALGDLGGRYLPMLCRIYSAYNRWFLGRVEESTRGIDAAVASAPVGSEPFNHCYALVFATILAYYREEPEMQRERAEQTVAVGEHYRFRFFWGIGRVFLAHARSHDEPGPERITELQDGMAMASSEDHRSGLPTILDLVSRMQQRMGDAGAAQATLDQAFEIASDGRQDYWNAQLLIRRGELAALRGEPDLTERAYREALETARAQGAVILQNRAVDRLTALTKGETT